MEPGSAARRNGSGPSHMDPSDFVRLSCWAWALRFALATLFLLALLQTGRLLWSEWQIHYGTLGSLEHTAGSGDERVWLAVAQLAPEREAESFEQALQLNPRDSAAWIRLGLVRERTGQIRAANAAFAEAECVDRQYVPAWARANFAFRHGDRVQFWKSAELALTVTRSEDLRAFFELADGLPPVLRTTGASAELTLLVERMGSNKNLVYSYLDYLIGKARWPDAHVLGLWMEARVSAISAGSPEADSQAGDAVRLADLTTRLITAGQIAGAVEIWNGLRGVAALVPQPGVPRPVAPQPGISLVNGKFTSSPSGRGFDWRLFDIRGIRSGWTLGRLESQVSGDQPDEAILLEQPLAVFDPAVAARAEVRWRFSFLPGSPRRTGMDPFLISRRPPAPDADACAFSFIWELEGPQGRRALTVSSVARAPGLGDQETLAPICVASSQLLPPLSPFMSHTRPPAAWTPAKSGEPAMVRLRLVLRRVEGHHPLQGTLVLHEVVLHEVTLEPHAGHRSSAGPHYVLGRYL